MKIDSFGNIESIGPFHQSEKGNKPSTDELLKNNEFLKGRKYVCAAPWVSLRFDFEGKMTACCVSRQYVLGTYPEVKPSEAWRGQKLKIMRNALSKMDFSKGCHMCKQFILAGNGHNTIITSYDNYVDENFIVGAPVLYPKHLSFQIHNSCNFECIMCGGEYSSGIRKKRDNLPPISNPYNEQFVEDIKLMLKYAKFTDFLGGEPFLVATNYKIWDTIKEINPTLQVNITTNGSIYNSRIEKLLLDLPNSSVHISLDSLDPKTYAFIRRNGNLEQTLKNIESFTKIGKMGSITMSPMIQNVYEIPNIIEFCIQRKLHFCINNVVSALGPLYKDIYENGTAKRNTDEPYTEDPIKEFRLWTLPEEERIKIKNFLMKKTFPKKYQDCIDSFINFLMNYRH